MEVWGYLLIWMRQISKKNTFFTLELFLAKKKLSVAPYFIIEVKLSIFWLNKGLMVYFDLYSPEKKVPASIFFYLLLKKSTVVKKKKYLKELLGKSGACKSK